MSLCRSNRSTAVMRPVRSPHGQTGPIEDYQDRGRPSAAHIGSMERRSSLTTALPATTDFNRNQRHYNRRPIRGSMLLPTRGNLKINPHVSVSGSADLVCEPALDFGAHNLHSVTRRQTTRLPSRLIDEPAPGTRFPRQSNNVPMRPVHFPVIDKY